MSLFIILVRFLSAPLILKWPIFGGAIAIILDNLDWYTKDLFGIPPVGDYQLIDKMLDAIYLSFLAIVTLRFKNKLVRNILISLFAYRLIGSILFEITHVRFLLLIFPNIFENFFFFYYIMVKVATYEPKISLPVLAIFLGLVTFYKMLQEYSIHVVDKPLPTIPQVVYLVGISVVAGLWYKRLRI